MKTKRAFSHWFFFFVNLENIFCCNWFKVKLVLSIVVCRYSFWVTVYDDCFVSQFFKLHCCVTTTVVEFNTLSDSVWTAAKNHNLLADINDEGESLPPGFSLESLHKCQSKLCLLFRFVASSPHPFLLGLRPKTRMVNCCRNLLFI